MLFLLVFVLGYKHLKLGHLRCFLVSTSGFIFVQYVFCSLVIHALSGSLASVVALESFVKHASIGLIMTEGIVDELGRDDERGNRKELGRLGSAPRDRDS